MKKLIPPILFLICIAAMIFIKNLIIIQEIIPRPFNYIGILFILTGLIMTIKVRKQFDKSHTEIHTFKKPRKLITNGLFKVSRNPIYLGFTISLLGVWVFLGTLLPVVGFLFFILVTNNYYIPFEEDSMERIFGTEYKNYKSKVRRWI
ncbi:methyltransferase family protein [Aquimarina sediminis]|uniref:methyltransferase family protein n=1 Tax=Aquimarina sediminis TaxID=2070536 RepID=UPI000CA08026|nr:isoprenylcysteine carboxylmethyltransferase family protein [Aquimarina sediminis]